MFFPQEHSSSRLQLCKNQLNVIVPELLPRHPHEANLSTRSLHISIQPNQSCVIVFFSTQCRPLHPPMNHFKSLITRPVQRSSQTPSPSSPLRLPRLTLSFVAFHIVCLLCPMALFLCVCPSLYVLPISRIIFLSLCLSCALLCYSLPYTL